MRGIFYRELFTMFILSKPTYYAEMLKRIQSVITNLQAHLPIKSLPSLENSH